MLTPSPRQVFDGPSSHWTFLTQDSDNDFEGQHFDRKETGKTGVDKKTLQNQQQDVRDGITQTVSAFANRNIEGGLLVLGIASDGTVSGIDHLSEEQKNSLTNFPTLLHHQAAEAEFYQCTDGSGSAKTICLIFVPHTTSGICETLGTNPKAWIRSGPQNISVTQDMRDQLRITKGLVDFEGAFCCPFNADDIATDVVTEFRKVFYPDSTGDFPVERLLYEAGAIIRRNGEYWFTYRDARKAPGFSHGDRRALPRSSNSCCCQRQHTDEVPKENTLVWVTRVMLRSRQYDSTPTASRGRASTVVEYGSLKLCVGRCVRKSGT